MAAVSKGMVRVGVLLSVLWVLFIGGIAVVEGQKRNDACAAAPKLGLCRHYFWAWEIPASDVKVKPAKETDDPEKKLQRIITRMAVDVIEQTQAREFRIQPDRVLLAMFGPLALLWSLGYGVAWCVQGFRSEKK